MYSVGSQGNVYEPLEQLKSKPRTQKKEPTFAKALLCV